MAKDPTPKPYTVPTPEEKLEQDSTALIAESLFHEAEHVLDPEQLSRLKKIVYYISKVGFSYEEACTLANVDYEALKDDIAKYPVIGRLLQYKELQYKKDLLLTITKKATETDDKLALWLLEKKYPNEFGSKKANTDPNDGNMLIEAMEFIQESNDSSPLVGRSIKITANTKAPHSGKALIQKVSDILN